METHRRLAPCPAALEDRKLGPSTGIEGEIEDRKGRDHNQEEGNCLVFVTCVCLHVWHSDFYIHGSCCLLGDVFCTLAVSCLTLLSYSEGQ